MARKDADALLLQVSADIRSLQKQFDKAVGVVDSGSKKMEARAKKLELFFGAANDNMVQKLSRGFGTAMGDNIRNLADSAGQATTILDGFGVAGIAAAAAIGALLVVLGQAKAAVAFGDAIADSAAKIGVSTDTLQEYRYAIHQVGGDYDDADEALSKFTQTFGKAQLGFSKKALKPFAALGFTKEDLNNLHSADAALQPILERLAGIQDESKRQALAAALGLEKFIPLAREGAGKLEDLRAAAHRLGYVMDADLVAKAGEANDKLEDLEAIANVQLKSAFVDLAPVILKVAEAIADAAREVNKIAGDIKDAMPVMQKWFGLLGDFNNATLDFTPVGQLKAAGGGIRAALGKAAEAGRAKSLVAGVQGLLAGDRIDRPADFSEVYGKTPPSFTPTDISGSGSTTRDTNAERTEAVNAMLAAASKDLLQAQNALTENVEARAQLERDITQQQLAQDQARFAAAKAALDDDRKTLKAKIDEAAVAAKKAAEARIELIEREAIWAAEDRDDATRKAVRDAELDTLQLQANLATTQAQRTEIEREILKLRQRELTIAEGKQLSRLEETGAISAEDGDTRRRAGAQQRDNERHQFDLDHEGPVRKYLRSIQDLNTEMQNAGVQAFDSLAGGLAEALANAKSLGDIGASVFKQLEIEILRLTIKAGAKEIASYFGYANGGYLGGFAGGGGLLRGPGTGTSDSILATNGLGSFARFSNGEFIVNAAATRKHRGLIEAINSGRIDRFAMGGLLGSLPAIGSLSPSLTGGLANYFDLRGAITTEQLLADMNKKIAASEQRSTVRGARGGAALAAAQAQQAASTRLGR